jgi:hypothetical protein
MTAARHPLLYALLAALYLLHTDLWLWDDPSWSFGLPVGLTYHVFYCLAAAAAMALLVRHAWPSALAVEDEAAESVPAADRTRASGEGGAE